MLAAQRAMADFTVKVGIGIHKGHVYEIGGGLYGSDADEIEGYTEEETKGGEVAVSQGVREALGNHLPTKEQRGGNSVLDHEACLVEGKPGDDVYYPAPFPRTFHDAIRTLDTSDAAALQRTQAMCAERCAVILVRVFHEHEQFLLDTFVARTAANAHIHRIAREQGGKMIESNGAVGIITTPDPAKAIACAKQLQQTLMDHGFTANVGVSAGEVLVFDFGNGTWNIAGSPVNISSKLAEDTLDRNVCFFEASVMDSAREQGITTPFEVETSGVVISGVKG
jgi:class 3 adenylate cyclase